MFEHYGEIGLEQAALKANVGSHSYYNKDRGEFKLYYAMIRKRGDDSYGTWLGENEEMALVLGVTLQAYEAAVIEYGGLERKEPVVKSFFEQEADCARFVEDYIGPLLLARKMGMGETLILQKNYGEYVQQQQNVV